MPKSTQPPVDAAIVPDIRAALVPPQSSQGSVTTPVSEGISLNPVGRFPIVGIGASAGGLAAFEAFFSGMPANTEPNMAFVLVQHLAPDHKSILAELVQRHTRMPVFEVEEGMEVKINSVYIIPPGCDMAYLNGRLQLLEPTAAHGHQLPIDFFFSSLAQDLHERAIGIVLSGTGSDGTLGLRVIKGEGGMAMVQALSSAEFDGMPRSALATGLIDYELPAAKMAEQLIAYTAQVFGKLCRASSALAPKSEHELRKIFILLRAQTGHNFSQYKPSTIQRRIERRMAVHQIETIDSYVKYLQKTPMEVVALFRDLLIGVTNFFRDPEVFAVLEERIIPRLFEGKSTGARVRVWSVGCSTGEEAYSLAILLQEHMEAIKQSFTVQVFATDIDPQAIATARAGLYPANIAAHLSSERLARYFTVEPDGTRYRINKVIRDMLVFSEQDLIKDPPFSKLDLISCRNLLIYMGGDLQKQVIPVFHYALNPSGRLLLGSSESIGDFERLFTVLDRKAKIYQRNEEAMGLSRVSLGSFPTHYTAREVALPAGGLKTGPGRKQPLRELTEQAILRSTSAGALINAQGDILYLHGRTGMFLELSQGEPSVLNLLKIARGCLRRELTIALHKALDTRGTVRCSGLRVKTNGHFTVVNLSVHPAAGGEDLASKGPLFLVLLEEVLEEAGSSVPAKDKRDEHSLEGSSSDTHARITALELELRNRDEYILTTQEQLETTNHELKSANEELQSVNEELQSTNEELETSKEELQSVNEELATVNAELQAKVADLSRSNNDMNNLLAGTGIGTIFVDHKLRILRFTPAVSGIINLIPSDVGRPVSHLVSNLAGYSSLVVDLEAVLATLVPKEVCVSTSEGRNFRMRIQPYRTLDNVIEGAVITFMDITQGGLSLVKGEALTQPSSLLNRPGAAK